MSVVWRGRGVRGGDKCGGRKQVWRGRRLPPCMWLCDRRLYGCTWRCVAVRGGVWRCTVRYGVGGGDWRG